jgi:glycosyltransferase A (GT-A) superfamily protein (DUF2064 family)
MPGVLLVAKAPVPGLAKTRLASTLGAEAAADLAAAALLDTLDAAEAWAPSSHRILALVGDLTLARRGEEVQDRLTRWHVVPQRGGSFAERLRCAHHDAADAWGRSEAVVQIGMDTPQLTPHDLDVLATAVTGPSRRGFGAMLGPATDGGWWGLATRRAGYVEALDTVVMSTADTCHRTAVMLRAAGAAVRRAHVLSDVDTVADAFTVAAQAPTTRFAGAVRDLRLGVAR